MERKFKGMLEPIGISAFESPGERKFTLGPSVLSERGDWDSCWSETWPILFGDKIAGCLIRDESFGLSVSGQPKFRASIRGLYWTYASDAPVGIGFDVSAYDSVEDVLFQWGCHADEIFDWADGKRIRSIYSRTGWFQKGASE